MQYFVRIAEELALRYAKGKDARGRKIKNNAHLLLAGVMGYPTPMNSKAWTDPEEVARYNRWKMLAIAELKREFGQRLRAVILHEDEAFPHLHFYAIPEGNSMTEIHRGNAARDSQTDTKKRIPAYKAAMKAWQDDYYEHVGMMSGFSRLGPGRQRLTRQEWKETRVANKLASDCHDRQLEAVTKQSKRLKIQAAQVRDDEEKVRAKAEAVERDKEKLDAAWVAVAAEKTRKNDPVGPKPTPDDDELARFGL